jgi:alkylation response protein AidB-like acyl-CoA dehydrogenase
VDISLSNADIAFRDEVRMFIGSSFTQELREASLRQAGLFADYELTRRWWAILYDRGWITPNWPAEYGGAGWTPMQRYIYDRECAMAGTPVLPTMGIQMCGPVIMRFGTPEQKAFFLPHIRSGEIFFCQGYSEPQAGSDLAALQTRAERDGDDYVLNGTKLWTTYAQHANWMFALVRTSSSGKPQAGISFLLLPMHSDGLVVRPIISISDDHDVNQVFFSNVRVPVSGRIGAENQGWQIAKYLLEFERGAGNHSGRIQRALDSARALIASRQHDRGVPDADLGRDLAELEIANMSIDMTERRVISKLSTGQNVGDATASMLKLLGAETLQKVTELAMRALGDYAMIDQTKARGWAPIAAAIGPRYACVPTARYLNMRAATIFGGSSEIQRNILARAALDL